MIAFDDVKFGDQVTHKMRGPGRCVGRSAFATEPERDHLEFEFKDFPTAVPAKFDRRWFELNGALLSKVSP